MVLLMSIVSFTFSLLLTPFFMISLGLIFIASIGKSLGIRKLYIKMLLTLFEYGRLNIEKVRLQGKTQDDKNKQDKGGGGGEFNSSTDSFNSSFETDDGKFKNGSLGNTVIARSRDLILVPEPEQKNKNNEDKSSKKDPQTDDDVNDKKNMKNYERQSSFETLHTVFDPTFCFDYIKAGVEAIIEDHIYKNNYESDIRCFRSLCRRL
ncbi:Protein of unknown function [Cotesia congregata]|uniref:Uncharacterized protein n=1 Tax=Cotesia congregata TaxID=51543 RepID=A0A8J2EKM2_COTCN|nr:Protein of unknown function [Cotesia congregata]